MIDRHPKWVRVEPGTVIPAGQPYRTEAADEFDNSEHMTACEFANGPGVAFTVDAIYDGEQFTMLVDSSWKPPLVLPTEPTWGIAVHEDGTACGAKWRLTRSGMSLASAIMTWTPARVVDFIEYTPEQVARIEAQR